LISTFDPPAEKVHIKTTFFSILANVDEPSGNCQLGPKFTDIYISA